METLATALFGKRLLIFDFDGTIADTSPLHARAFAQVLGSHGLTVNYPAIAGRETPDAIRSTFALAGRPEPDEVTIAELTRAKRALVREFFASNLRPLPEVDAFLRWARGRYSLALATSGSRATVEPALRQLGYADWFVRTVFAEDVAFGKPAPDSFLAALGDVPAAEALIFEDSDSGFLGANRAGIHWINAPVALAPSVFDLEALQAAVAAGSIQAGR